MIVTSDTPKLLLAGMRAEFFGVYNPKEPDARWRQFSMEVPSTKDQETYPWLGNNAGMRQFIDERQLKALKEYSYTLANKTWEASIGVDRVAIEDDQYGQIMTRVRLLSGEPELHKEQLVFEGLAGGFASTVIGTCYDGQYFFDSDHSSGDSGTQSNLGTAALGAASLKAARIAMLKFKDDRGRPMNVEPDTLVVPPDLLDTALELVGSPFNPESANQVKNTLYQALTVISNPYLTDTNNWMLLCTKRMVKPMIMQIRTNVEFTGLETDSDTGFMRDMWAYGVRQRYAVGYGMWQYAYGAAVT